MLLLNKLLQNMMKKRKYSVNQCKDKAENTLNRNPSYHLLMRIIDSQLIMCF